MDLNKLLRAKSIAVVGASEKPGFGGDTCRNIITFKKDMSRVYFVNPKRDTVFGYKCYDSLSSIDDDIDLVILCTPQKTIIPLLREAKTKNCGGAVVFASGYSETGTEEGKAAEEELRQVAEELGIAIMGPNCGGFNNYVDDVIAFAFPVEDRDRKGSIGFISQSGQFCINLLDSPGMNFSYAISTGNSKIITLEDYFDFLLDDEATKVISIYMEGNQNHKKFVECLKKAAKIKKPVVVLKGGRSEKGRQNAASHTGSMAGSDETYDAIFKKFGVIRVDDMQDLLSTSMILSTLVPYPAGDRVASLNISGGENGICADMGSMYGINYPDFAEETVKKLEEMLPSYATVNNPLDMTATLVYDADLYAEAIKTVMNDENIDILLIGLTIQLEVTDPSLYTMYEGIKKVVEGGNTKPIAILPFVEGTRNFDLSNKFAEIGVPILPSPKYAFPALANLFKFINYNAEEKVLDVALPDNEQAGKTRALSEVESKSMLKEYGVPIDLGYIAKNRDEVKEYFEKLGAPIVMKIESNDILHKSDVGGVKLNINDVNSALKAYDEIMESVTEKAPEAKINGVLMQKMLPKGVEIIIGVNNDPQFGPMLLVGLGGVFVELFKDVALYPVPLNKKEACDMLTSLKSFKLLTGYRGSKPCDIDALTDTMVAISDFALANRNRLKELDINPLFVYEKGVGVADALVVLNEEE